jgi:hypothetical protein
VSISTPDKPYSALVAPSSQLALASTLIVYPPITTKSRSVDRQKDADAALRYLRNVCRTVDPLSENIMVSFTFPDEGSRRRIRGYRSADTESDDGEDSERLTCPAATAHSVWQRADDFWHIAGWAFNCSKLWNKRWERWKLWLEVMLDLVEKEWEERTRLSEDPRTDTDKTLMESLLWQYISSQDPQSRSSRRRIMRAILAMGGVKSKKEFPEIWLDETTGPKLGGEDTRGPGPIDIENDDFGDYEHDDEDEIMEGAPQFSSRFTRRSASSRKALAAADDGSSTESEDESAIMGLDGAIDRLGGMDAIHLRQRLLNLVSTLIAFLYIK